MCGGAFVAYFRVSTWKQGQSGLGLEAQRAAVLSYVRDATLIEEFTEVESGKRNDRPALARALALCQLHGATLIIAKLDRLARNVHFISGLMESGVEFVAVDFPKANRLTLHLLSAVAEHEASMISARTKAALQAAKARGVQLGGDRGNLTSVSRKGAATSAKVRSEKAKRRAQLVMTKINGLRESGSASLREIADGLNRANIPTARGLMWGAEQVRQTIRRAGSITQ